MEIHQQIYSEIHQQTPNTVTKIQYKEVLEITNQKKTRSNKAWKTAHENKTTQEPRLENFRVGNIKENNNLLANILTDNITELNDLIYTGVKYMSSKSKPW